MSLIPEPTNSIQALNQLPDTTKMIEPVIAGAVYDFAGFITTRNKVIRVGATADAAPVADLVKEWAERRGLSLENAAVGSWEKALAESQNSTTDVVESEKTVAWFKSLNFTPLTDEEIDEIANQLDDTTIGWSTHEFARAIEAKLKEKNS